jgi:hypothetical protein
MILYRFTNKQQDKKRDDIEEWLETDAAQPARPTPLPLMLNRCHDEDESKLTLAINDVGIRLFDKGQVDDRARRALVDVLSFSPPAS